MRFLRIFGNKRLKKEIQNLTNELSNINYENDFNKRLSKNRFDMYWEEKEKNISLSVQNNRLKALVEQLQNELKVTDEINDSMLEIQEKHYKEEIESLKMQGGRKEINGIESLKREVEQLKTQLNVLDRKYKRARNDLKNTRKQKRLIETKNKEIQIELKDLKKQLKRENTKEVVVRSKVIDPNEKIFKRYVRFVEIKKKENKKLDNFEYLVLNYKKLPTTKKVERLSGSYNRQEIEKVLPNELDDLKWKRIMKEFNNKCALSGKADNITLEHFIPVSTGHGGMVEGNVFPLNKSLNFSKNNRNPFYWFSKNDFPVEFSLEAWEKLISYLASKNNLTVPEYVDFVNWCFENPRTAEEIKADDGISSLELWKKHTKALAKAN